MIGDKFGRFTVVKGPYKVIGDREHKWVTVRCECGRMREYRVDTLSRVESCGCHRQHEPERKRGRPRGS